MNLVAVILTDGGKYFFGGYMRWRKMVVTEQSDLSTVSMNMWQEDPRT